MKTIVSLLLMFISIYARGQQVKDSVSVHKQNPPNSERVIPAKVKLYPVNEMEKCTIRPQSPMNYTFTREELRQMPITNIQDAIATLPGAYQRRSGDRNGFFGSEGKDVLYVVDGVELIRR